MKKGKKAQEEVRESQGSVVTVPPGAGAGGNHNGESGLRVFWVPDPGLRCAADTLVSPTPAVSRRYLLCTGERLGRTGESGHAVCRS